MIRPGYKYKVKYVKAGKTRAKQVPYVAFSISEQVKDGDEKMWSNWRVMVFQDLDIREEDTIKLVKIESINSSIYRNQLQHTIFAEVELEIPEPEYEEEAGTGEPGYDDEDAPFDL